MKKFKSLLVAVTCLYVTVSFAGIEPTSGRFVDSNTDLSIKVIGGHLTWKRQYRDRQWRFNKSWESLVLTYDTATGNVQSIRRADDMYKKLDSAGTVFKFGHRRTIRKQADGTWLWKNRDGNSTKYDANGKTLSIHTQAGSKLTLMYNGDNKLSGVKDVNDVQVLWLEYDVVTGQVSKAKDYGNREVVYTWQVVNATASPKRYKLINVKDARGYDWQYAYAGTVAKDGRVDVISKADPEGRVQTVAYAGSGRTSGVTNALGHTTNYQFDYIKSRKEFYLKATYPGGRVTETWYERDGEVKRKDINGINIITITEDLRKDIETDTFGRVTTKEYDEFRNLIKTTYPDGTSTSTTFDVSNSNVLTKTDERGTVTKYEYWPNGRMKKMTEALGTSVERSTEYTYDQYGQMLTKTQLGDSVTEAATTQYFYDGFGNISKIIDAELNERQYTSYDSQGNKLIMIDGRGNSWTYGYDALSNQTNNKNPLNEETTNLYDKFGNLIKTIYPDNSFIQFEYDNENRVIKYIDELGNFSTNTYDQAGNKIAVVDKAGRSINIEFDILNRTKEMSDESGNKISFVYPEAVDSQQFAASIFKPKSIIYPTFTNNFKFNLRKKVIEESIIYQNSNNQILTQVFSYKYDENNNLVETNDFENKVTKAEYDLLNRKIKTINNLLHETSYTYDNRNNQIGLTDSLNQKHTFEFDKLNRKLLETRPMGQTESFAYNSDSLLSSKIDSKGQKTEYVYDAANRNVEIKYFKSNQTLDKSVLFTFNSRGSLASYNDGISQGSYTYDHSQQGLSETVTYNNETFNYYNTYNPDGRKSSFTGQDGVTYNYYYNNMGVLNNIVIPNEGNISYQNFLMGLPQKIQYPGGVERNIGYDNLLRINTINVTNSANQVLMNYTYNLTANGKIAAKNTEHGNYSYSYDEIDRLVTADYPTITDELFTYDSLGNRKTDSNTGVIEWLYNQNNQLLNSVNHQFRYDANGSQVEIKNSNGILEKQYIYNVENRLSEIKDSNGITLATYYYDPFGRRLSKTVLDTDGSLKTTYFQYSQQGLIAEKTNEILTSYIFNSNNNWSTNPVFKRVNNNYYYYQNDTLMTPQIIHDKNGEVVNSKEMQVHGAWTNPINIISDNLGFPGQYLDRETNTLYNFKRYYNPQIGRYQSSDPINLIGGINLYEYALSNPVNYIDSRGKSTIAIGGGAAAGIGLGAGLIIGGGIIILYCVYSGNCIPNFDDDDVDDKVDEEEKCEECDPNDCDLKPGEIELIEIHYNAHQRLPGGRSGSHGCEEKTGSPVHYHYLVGSQGPPPKCICRKTRRTACGYPTVPY